MAKTNFTYACGHDGVVTGSNRADADRRAKRAARDLCWTCQCAAESDAAIAWAEASGLPPLTGTSVKQIRYGETLRRVRLTKVEALVVDAQRRARQQDARDACELLLSEYRAVTDARAWIDAVVGYGDQVDAALQQRPDALVLPGNDLAIANLMRRRGLIADQAGAVS